MKLTDALLGEHGAFNAMFSKIEELAETSGELAQIESAVAVLATEIETHATLEEELLLPPLNNPPVTDELLAEMHAEHREIHRALEQIENARDISEALELVRQAMGLARRHFEKEETTLYPMAQQMLGDEKLIELADAWAAARHVHIE